MIFAADPKSRLYVPSRRLAMPRPSRMLRSRRMVAMSMGHLAVRGGHLLKVPGVSLAKSCGAATVNYVQGRRCDDGELANVWVALDSPLVGKVIKLDGVCIEFNEIDYGPPTGPIIDPSGQDVYPSCYACEYDQCWPYASSLPVSAKIAISGVIACNCTADAFTSFKVTDTGANGVHTILAADGWAKVKGASGESFGNDTNCETATGNWEEVHIEAAIFPTAWTVTATLVSPDGSVVFDPLVFYGSAPCVGGQYQVIQNLCTNCSYEGSTGYPQAGHGGIAELLELNF